MKITGTVCVFYLTFGFSNTSNIWANIEEALTVIGFRNVTFSCVKDGIVPLAKYELLKLHKVTSESSVMLGQSRPNLTMTLDQGHYMILASPWSDYVKENLVESLRNLIYKPAFTVLVVIDRKQEWLEIETMLSRIKETTGFYLGFWIGDQMSVKAVLTFNNRTQFVIHDVVQVPGLATNIHKIYYDMKVPTEKFQKIKLIIVNGLLGR